MTVSLAVGLFGALSLASDGTAASTRAGGGLALTPTGGPAAKAPAGKAPSVRLAPRFGNRVLRQGMSGRDVQVLNGIVKSKAYSHRVRLNRSFERPTASAVRDFQERADIRANGVVNRATAKSLTRSMRRAGASWYGPGTYGNRTACGKVLRPTTIGVAHKKLPCGSKVLIAYHGRYLLTRVIDRGPYVKGRSWDLTNGARAALKYKGVDKIRYAVAAKKKR